MNAPEHPPSVIGKDSMARTSGTPAPESGQATWALTRKVWLETRWLLAGLFVMMTSLFWMRVWLISRLDSGRFQQILELLPDGIRSMTRVDFDWIVTYAGRLSMGFEEPIVVMVMTIWAVSRGSDLIAGELSRGTMEMMLAQPVSRRRVFWVPVSYALLGLVLLATASLVGTGMGVWTIEANEARYPAIDIPFWKADIPLPFLEPEMYQVPMTELISLRPFWPAALNLLALGVFLLGLSVAFSAYDRHRWRSIGLVTVVLIVMTMIKILAMSQPSFNWMLWLTAFTAYEPALFVQQSQTDPASLWSFWYHDANGGFHFSHWAYDALLLAMGLGLLWHASFVFQRRDLPAPL